MATDFKHINLTKEDIIGIKRDKFNNADNVVGMWFDPCSIDSLSNEKFDLCISEIYKKITDQIENDFEMCTICEMAIAYLEEHKAMKEAKNERETVVSEIIEMMVNDHGYSPNACIINDIRKFKEANNGKNIHKD